MNSKIIECFVLVGCFFLVCGIILGLYQIPVYFGINDEFLRAGFVFFAPFVIMFVLWPFLREEDENPHTSTKEGYIC